MCQPNHKLLQHGQGHDRSARVVLDVEAIGVKKPARVLQRLSRQERKMAEAKPTAAGLRAAPTTHPTAPAARLAAIVLAAAPRSLLGFTVSRIQRPRLCLPLPAPLQLSHRQQGLPFPGLSRVPSSSTAIKPEEIKPAASRLPCYMHLDAEVNKLTQGHQLDRTAWERGV
jgi:hypothetical protein